MGYDAFVLCNCFKNKLTPPLSQNEYIVINEYGVDIDFPDGLWQSDEVLCTKLQDEFYEWKNSSCPHPNFKYLSQDLCNTIFMAYFRDFVRQSGGKEKFPILSEYLPTSNDGNLPLQFTDAFIAELLKLEDPKSIKSTFELLEIETESNNIRVKSWDYCYDYQRWDCGLDEKGVFYIIESTKVNGKEVSSRKFVSTNFTQNHLSNNKWLYTDIETNITLECPLALQPKAKEKLNYEFKVINEKYSNISEFEYLIEKLIILAKASIETSNPIQWC